MAAEDADDGNRFVLWKVVLGADDELCRASFLPPSSLVLLVDAANVTAVELLFVRADNFGIWNFESNVFLKPSIVAGNWAEPLRLNIFMTSTL